MAQGPRTGIPKAPWRVDEQTSTQRRQEHHPYLGVSCRKHVPNTNHEEACVSDALHTAFAMKVSPSPFPWRHHCFGPPFPSRQNHKFPLSTMTESPPVVCPCLSASGVDQSSTLGHPCQQRLTRLYGCGEEKHQKETDLIRITHDSANVIGQNDLSDACHVVPGNIDFVQCIYIYIISALSCHKSNQDPQGHEAAAISQHVLDKPSMLRICLTNMRTCTR